MDLRAKIIRDYDNYILKRSSFNCKPWTSQLLFNLDYLIINFNSRLGFCYANDLWKTKDQVGLSS